MFAVISDIHSNLEALTTVLADIEKLGIKTIYCLGDVIGYGSNQRECLDLIIEKTKWCVLGNHDYATSRQILITAPSRQASGPALFWKQTIKMTLMSLTTDAGAFLANFRCVIL